MKYYTSLYLNIIAICIAAGLFFPQVITAETNVDISNNGAGSKTNVNVETNTGNNTICRNGTCTTTNSDNSKSEVCVNGKCISGQDGKVDYESEDGNIKVHINNNNKDSSSENNSEQENDVNENNENNTVNTDTNNSNNTPNSFDEKKNQIKPTIANMHQNFNTQRSLFRQLIDGLRNIFRNFRML